MIRILSLRLGKTSLNRGCLRFAEDVPKVREHPRFAEDRPPENASDTTSGMSVAERLSAKE